MGNSASSDYFPLLIGALGLGIAVNMSSNKPFDWLTSPGQRWIERNPGYADLAINYAPQIPYFQSYEDPFYYTGEKRLAEKAYVLEAANSFDKNTQQTAVDRIVDQNLGWGSGKMGDSYPYAYYQ